MVEGEQSVVPSKQYLKQEVDNVIAVCNSIGRDVAEGTLPSLTLELLCGYNRKLLNALPAGEGVVPGEIRTHSVVVGSVYRGAPANDCAYLVDRLCSWLDGPDFEAPPGLETVYAVIKAVVAHLYLAWIHPFGDGNGRVARLLEFHILLAAGIPSPAAHLLSNHYNQTRGEYYRQLEYASKSGGDILPFLAYAVQGFVDGLREQLEYIWTQQWDVVWRNYVHEAFKNKTGESQDRQRKLVLDLGAHEEWIDVGKVVELTPRLAKAYAKKTAKTAQRDLNALVKMGLVERKGKRVRARHEVIRQFLPLRSQNKPPSETKED